MKISQPISFRGRSWMRFRRHDHTDGPPNREMFEPAGGYRRKRFYPPGFFGTNGVIIRKAVALPDGTAFKRRRRLTINRQPPLSPTATTRKAAETPEGSGSAPKRRRILPPTPVVITPEKATRPPTPPMPAPRTTLPLALAQQSKETTPPSPKPIAITPEKATTPRRIAEGNGEGQEEVVIELRAKLYHLDAVKKEEHDETLVAEAVPSIPSAPGRMHLRKKEGGNDGATEEATDEDKNNKPTKKMAWKEKGIGPVRILWKQENGRSCARLVQRMETECFGKGHRLMLNVALNAFTKAFWESENENVFRFNTLLPQTGKDAVVGQYLFKFKTSADARDLAQKLNEAIRNATTTTMRD